MRANYTIVLSLLMLATVFLSASFIGGVPFKQIEIKTGSAVSGGFEQIDAMARLCPKADSKDIASIAAYLNTFTNTDLEKTRAIFTWITDNIGYDIAALEAGTIKDVSPEYVLKKGKSVCQGYTNLFSAIGRSMGLNVITVPGYAKQYNFNTRHKYRDPNHAWNMVKIDDKWVFVDATWGASAVFNDNGKIKTEQRFDDFWFDTDPYIAIYSHMPLDPFYGLVEPKMELEVYQQMPWVYPAYFNLGYDPVETYRYIHEDPTRIPPDCYQVPIKVTAIDIPRVRQLTIGETYHFELNVPKAKSVALLNKRGDFTIFKQEGNVFNLEFIPSKIDDIKVVLFPETNDDSYFWLLKYEVD